MAEQSPAVPAVHAPDAVTPARGMRARLARMGSRTPTGNPVLEPLFRTVRANHPKADLALLERAYVTAEQYHATQMRKSGDPYITHPLAVTTIRADAGRGAAARHGRGHRIHPRPAARGLRRRGRDPGRRRDQAREGQVRRRG